MSDTKQLLAKRKILKAKKPSFIRDGFGKRKRIDTKWRKPKGRHSKQRHGMAGHGKKVDVGFRTDSRVRGLHQNGLVPIVVSNINEISQLIKGEHGAIIGRNVGDRKRLLLIDAAKKHGIEILNLKDNHSAKIQERVKQRKSISEAKAAEKESKNKKEVKKEAKEITEEDKASQEKKEKDKIITKADK